MPAALLVALALSAAGAPAGSRHGSSALLPDGVHASSHPPRQGHSRKDIHVAPGRGIPQPEETRYLAHVPDGALRSGNCSTYGFGVSGGFDPTFKKVSLWKKQGGGGGGAAKAASLRRWAGSTSCEGEYSVLSIDVLDQCTPCMSRWGRSHKSLRSRSR